MTDHTEGSMSPFIENDDRGGQTESSIEGSSSASMEASTTVDSDQVQENGPWPYEEQDDVNNPFHGEENSSDRAVTQETVENVPLPSSGLVNEGCTCYLNSLLQLLFHLGYFRNAVYRMPESDDVNSYSISQALKELFFRMQKSKTPGYTKKLTAAFGWTEKELFIQHDIQEMATLLRENLEEKMKGTVTEGTINQLFEGRGEQVVKTLDNLHESRSRDTFYDIHLPLGPYENLIDSLRSLTAKEELFGDNKYRVEMPGKKPEYKDAEKSYEFRRFPPVIWFHLKRFDMNLMSPSLEMKKVNSRLQFPLELCLEELEKGDKDSESETKPNESQENNNKEEKEKENTEEKEKEEKEQPFSTHSPAIYDLQGVIVHRGSVRSGHYYCYIRQWDPIRKCFIRWIEYDDDKVTVVPEDSAVSNNFGGRLVQQGRMTTLMATNNAYILSYVRRAECPMVLNPPSPDSIPQRVRDAFDREIEEDEKRRQTEKKLQNRLNLIILTDELISKRVKEEQGDIFPINIRTANTNTTAAFDIELEVQKDDKVRFVYEKIAALKQLSALQLTPRDFRLWRSSPHHGHRRILPLELYDDCGERLMYYCLDKNEHESRATSIFLYMQLPTTLPPFPVTDVTSLFKTGDCGGWNDNTYSKELRVATPIDGVTFHWVCRSGLRSMLIIHLRLFDSDDVCMDYSEHVSTDQILHTFKVNPEGRLIHRLDYRLEVRNAHTSVEVRDVRISAPAAAIPDLQPKYNPGTPWLQETNRNNVLIFFKYYNCLMCRLIYAGSAIIPLTAKIGDCVNVLRHFMGDEIPATKRIQMLVETHPMGHPLRNDDIVDSAYVVNGSVLIGQQEERLLVYRYPTVDKYLLALSRLIHVRVLHIKFGKNPTPLMPMFYSKGSDSVGVSSSSTNTIKGGVNDILAGKDGDKNMMSINSPVVEFVFSGTGEEKDLCDTGFYASRTFELIKEYRLSMDNSFIYTKVCEVIGDASGYNPNYIRLYRASINMAEQVLPEVDPLRSSVSLRDFLGVDRNPVLFFEILPETRRFIESLPRVVATVRSAKNESLYTERVVLKKNVTFGDFLPGILQRCSHVLQSQQRSTVNNNNNTNEHHNKRHNVNSDNSNNTNMNSSNTNTLSTSSTNAMDIASHYLIVLLDGNTGVIRKIIEAPITPDGKCECSEPITAEPEPLVFSLVPAEPLLENQFRIACCHGYYTGCVYNYDNATLWQPFVLTVNKTITITKAREMLLAYSGVSPNEVEAANNGLMMYAGNFLCFKEWGEPVFNYWNHPQNNGDYFPSLVLNHKRPREKPGSRYVAQNNPALRISKR